MSTTLKIAVAEPSLIIRSGLLSVLKRLSALNVQIVEIADIGSLVDILKRQSPDMLIINPALLGLFSLQQVRNGSGCRSLRCIALLNNLPDESLTNAYDETISIYDTAETIREKLQRLALPEGQESDREQLSTREKEIIVCVAKGMTNKQIAEKLFISTHTVITHRRNIAAKLQIHSPAGLTIYAIVNRLVELNQIKETIQNSQE